MANPISKLDLVVNGVTTSYDIHDANAVDLTNNQTVGGIKTFSNAPVVGSIDLDGKSIDTDANGNMTYDSHIVDTIEEQGDGYIRYTSGLQICWGMAQNNNNVSTGIARISFPKVFMSVQSLVATSDTEGKWILIGRTESNSTWILQAFAAWVSPIEYNNGPAIARYVAIGKWK